MVFEQVPLTAASISGSLEKCPLELARRVEHPKANVIICPGGAYRSLSPREAYPVARAFAESGRNAWILHSYIRSSQQWPRVGTLAVEQLSRAVVQVWTEDLSVPTVVCGFSAGAHLAASLGVLADKLKLIRPSALILSYPVITAGEYRNEESFENLDAPEMRDFWSLEQHVTPDTPPCFLWHTVSDASVPVQNSLLFAQALTQAGVSYEMHLYPQGPHGLSLATPEVAQPEKNRFPDSHVAGWFGQCTQWLDTLGM